MIRSITAWAIFALMATSLVAFSDFAPQVAASETTILAKGNRLVTRPVAEICSHQVWPHFDESCLRQAGSTAPVEQARLVSEPPIKQFRR
jgi:hypothetical protein